MNTSFLYKLREMNFECTANLMLMTQGIFNGLPSTVSGPIQRIRIRIYGYHNHSRTMENLFFLVVSRKSDLIKATAPTQIALVDTNATEMTLHTNANSLPRIRQDQEVFITKRNRLYIFNRLLPATLRNPIPQIDGLWCIDLGLGPAN